MERLELPLEEAVVAAAEQNFRTDVKRGLVQSVNWLSKTVRQDYKEEARTVLLSDGENYLPEEGETTHIVLKKEKRGEETHT